MVFINKDAFNDNDLFASVVIEQLRNQGFEIDDETEYDIPNKTHEEIEELKKKAKWIAKNGGPKYGIYRSAEDFGFDKE